MADPIIATIGQEISLTMPDGAIGDYVYVLPTGALTCTPQINQTPSFIKLSATTAILLDGGMVNIPTIDSGTQYEDYILYIDTNPTIAINYLKYFIRDITKKLLDPYAISMDGNSYTSTSLEITRQELTKQLNQLIRGQRQPFAYMRPVRY